MTINELEMLLKDMSLEEKVNQMLQVIGHYYLESSAVTGPMKEKGFTENHIAQAGSVTGVLGAEKLKKIQKSYMEKHPHKIPLLFMLDVINGFRTVFPIPLGQGATFEPDLSYKCASAAAKEAAVSGIHVTFAPMVDLVRDARWGRVMESTGEDPFLNGLFSEAMVKGFQGDDLKKPYHVAACVKHFAGYGAPTAGRDYNTAELSEHTLREYYLPSYQAGIDADAAMVMTAFNTINGIPATGNKWLMRDILRDEMNFDGVLISDWSAMEEMIEHGYCDGREEAAVRSLEAGVDIDMMTGIYADCLCDLVKNHVVDEKMIDDGVMRILKLKNKLGLFENPYKDADETLEMEIILSGEHRRLAREAARKSFVLLKNEGVLPIKKKKKTAFIGPYMNSRNILGAWSFIGKAEDAATIQEAAKERYGDSEIMFCEGCPMLGDDVQLIGFTEKVEEKVSKEVQDQMMEEAMETAAMADIIIMPLGEHRLQSGEAASKGYIRIPEIQMNLFDRVYDVNPNIVVVLFTGRPLDIGRIAEKAKAVLVVWLPGTEGAHAILDVLTGEYNPGGKLPMSFPYCVGQVPVHYNEYATGRPHVKGKDKDRFRSKYLDIPNEPLYPFGYGLSYTEFSISPVNLAQEEMKKEGTITASVKIKNEGKVSGTEVVQMYIRDLAASVVRPVRELKNFIKVELQPGEEKTISFKISKKELQFYTGKGIVDCEPGAFEVFIGGDSTTSNGAKFWLNE